MNYRIIDKETYYRKGVYRHFTEDCKCSASLTARIDVTDLAAYSRQTGTRFYINFLYILSKVLNSRDDYRMGYLVVRGTDVKRVFLDEIAVLVIENPAVSLTGCLIETLTEKKIESREHPLLSAEKRVIVDADLCEIG